MSRLIQTACSCLTKRRATFAQLQVTLRNPAMTTQSQLVLINWLGMAKKCTGFAGYLCPNRSEALGKTLSCFTRFAFPICDRLAQRVTSKAVRRINHIAVLVAIVNLRNLRCHVRCQTKALSDLLLWSALLFLLPFQVRPVKSEETANTVTWIRALRPMVRWKHTHAL